MTVLDDCFDLCSTTLPAGRDLLILQSYSAGPLLVLFCRSGMKFNESLHTLIANGEFCGYITYCQPFLEVCKVILSHLWG